MKKNQLSKKLQLNKTTVANMNEVKGGKPPYGKTEVVCSGAPSVCFPTECFCIDTIETV